MKAVTLTTADDKELVVFVEQVSCLKALGADRCEVALTGGFTYIVKGEIAELTAKIAG
jgi:hypothetical protein